MGFKKPQQGVLTHCAGPTVGPKIRFFAKQSYRGGAASEEDSKMGQTAILTAQWAWVQNGCISGELQAHCAPQNGCPKKFSYFFVNKFHLRLWVRALCGVQKTLTGGPDPLCGPTVRSKKLTFWHTTLPGWSGLLIVLIFAKKRKNVWKMPIFDRINFTFDPTVPSVQVGSAISWCLLLAYM